MAFPTLGDFFQHYLGFNLPLPIPMFGFWVALCFLVGSSVYTKEVERLIREKKIPDTEKIRNYSGTVAFIGMLLGMVGARVFHILEYPGQFVEDPMGMIFSRGGYTILGGLLFSVIAGSYYTKKIGLPLPRMYDTFVPVLPLGYAIGRIGCQLSGDGDWGIAANMALKPDWLPDFLWATTYQNNVIGEIIPAPGVYPTPLYEVIMSLFIFVILWQLRGHRHQLGWLGGVYLLLSGVERYLIEQIRVNSVYNIFGSQWTQAELISLAMIALGGYLMFKLWPERGQDELVTSPKRKSKKRKKS